ncbi:YabK [Niallia circulans]|jgi:hypothetical protein|uniref:anti-sigma-F factor Fin family protein n=1 Tax=Shouchella clausii TaxID=79880 RepID=UPI000B97C88B|nr:anti-sigma-F factor Fin family protein [Shouchella clausii]SPU18531.1 YabK [Niallia circulans]AST95560.1 peptide ABC transporter permease [Shouchella clausii]MCM3550274.1 anti-sigma-F factor Fin family protein [Shouchella clausii]MCR1288449.1 anti-sigma-F factor Fin family protein [Shouchella clausii]MEB5472335.1 anti-sigma-F factor Fin family protein [Shouchella clausii]
MAVYYGCRHCGQTIGVVFENATEADLGFHELNEMEKDELLTYSENGDIHVKAICEDCYTALSDNPQLYSYPYFIH